MKFNRIYTTGVFDSLHYGHIRLLANSKNICEHLCVGVSSDELVMKYKNKKPLQNLEQRIEVLSAVRYVDSIVIQNDRNNKLNDCIKNNCDCMVVGDDWKGSEIFAELEINLKKNNISLIYMPYTKGISSTLYSKNI